MQVRFEPTFQHVTIKNLEEAKLILIFYKICSYRILHMGTMQYDRIDLPASLPSSANSSLTHPLPISCPPF